MVGLADKGFLGALRRTAIIPARYGLGSQMLRKQLLKMSEFFAGRYEIQPTVPVTAIVLERHLDLAATLAGLDVAVHGYRHVAYAGKPDEQQRGDLAKALVVFAESNINPKGFRAPYLRFDKSTIAVLVSQGLLFDSSAPSFGLPSDDPAYERAVVASASRYGPPMYVSRPTVLQKSIVEVPVSLPDDEILVDGLGIRSPMALSRIFRAMLGRARATGSCLVLQVHPERFEICRIALDNILTEATDDGAWKASISDVASWVLGAGPNASWPDGSPYCISVSGDLDAVSIGDFASRLLGA